MSTFSSPHFAPASPNRRIGFHYFPDTFHYREADLAAWLPELTAMNASWLVLHSELDRAVPEHFLRGLKTAGIEPLIHFQPALDASLDLRELRTLLEVYERWGVRSVILFDRPNTRASWPGASWAQADLVERFLDRFLPAAALAAQIGLAPVFPPLHPGGSYWDTAFLRTALQAMQRRKQEPLLARLGLAAYGWSWQRSLDWGGGGPERWPESRPYLTPPGSQDQCGFRIFDWYQAVAQAVLHHPCPLFLLQAASPVDPSSAAMAEADPQAYAADCLAIARLLDLQPGSDEPVLDPLNPENPLEPIPPLVVACNFWLLPGTGEYPAQAWYDAEAQPGPLAAAFREQRRSIAQLQRQQAVGKGLNGEAERRPIQHYLLLPGFEWGVSDWYLEVIRPYVKKYKPTIGFSAQEASLAARVTVVGNSPHFTDEMLHSLEASGCLVEQIDGDGTSIATQLAER